MIEVVTFYTPPDWSGDGPWCETCGERYRSLGEGPFRAGKTSVWAHVVVCGCGKHRSTADPDESAHVGLRIRC